MSLSILAKRFLLLFFLGLVLFLGSCDEFPWKPIGNPGNPGGGEEADTLAPGELEFLDSLTMERIVKINIEIADDPIERSRGLSFRDSLAQDSGMLFCFEQPDFQTFTMLSTFFSLDILFVDENKKIVNIAKNTIPDSFDLIPSVFPVLYVVEVNGGFSDENGIEVGDLIEFKK